MTPDLIHRITSRLNAVGKNPSAAALEAGLGRSAVRDILVGKVEHPRIDTLQKLTGPLQCSLEYLTGADSDAGSPGDLARKAASGFLDPTEVNSFRVLESGVFRTADAMTGTAHWEGEGDDRDLVPSERFIIHRDARYIEWPVSLYQMNDGSLDAIGIRKGDFLTVAGPSYTSDAIIPLKHGTIVVTSLHLNKHSLREISARLVDVRKDGVYLATRLGSQEGAHKIMDTDLDDVAETAIPNTYFTVDGSVTVCGIAVRLIRNLPVD